MQQIRRQSQIILLFFCTIFCFALAGCTEGNNTTQVQEAETNIPTGEIINCQVLRVVDGDTIVISYQGQEEKVRLIGIDTPESVHPQQEKNVLYGKIATAFTKEQLDQKTVGIELDVQERDQYGRLLAYVYVDGKLFNQTILENGHAKLSTYPPNVKYVDQLTAAETQAREAKVGLWAEDTAELLEPEVPLPDLTTTEAEGTLLGNANSKKYHLPDCSGAQNMSEQNKVWFKTAADAETSGYSPCQLCHPEETNE